MEINNLRWLSLALALGVRMTVVRINEIGKLNIATIEIRVKNVNINATRPAISASIRRPSRKATIYKCRPGRPNGPGPSVQSEMIAQGVALFWE
jgi:hypothetical protein